MAQELKHRKGWVAVKELELRRANSKGWAVVGRTSIEQEETAEVIVPDAQPDIWQVWDASTCLLLQRKEVREGQAALYGLLKVTILYQPEGTGGVESMEATLPFDAAPELPGLTRQSLLHVCPKVLGTETRLLNPRKILVRVAYQLDLTAFGPAEQGVPSQVEEPGPYGICQKTGEWHSDETVHVQEKNFTYQDTLVLPGGRPDAERLLATRTACACHEAKVIGSKLVFKGEAAVRLLYQAEDGAVQTADFHLPYSQLMDARENSQDSSADLALVFTDCTCTPVEGDRRSFQVSLALQAQAVFRKEETLPLLTDLYSTSHDLEIDRATCLTCRLSGQGEGQETVRLQLPASNVTGQLVEVQVHLGRSSQRQEGEAYVLTQEIESVVLYETEEGLASARQKSQVQHRITGEGPGRCQFTVELLRDPAAAPVGEGIEVTALLSFRWRILEEAETAVIQQVLLGEPRQADPNEPSVILRAVHPGEDLWAVAKAYHTTDEAILAASGLDSEEIYPGQRLLIPRTAG